MGGNISRQITDLTEKAVMSTTLEFSQKNTTTINNTQEVVIEDVDGAVDIGEINLTQQVEVDVKQSLQTLSETAAQAKLKDTILQETKQIVSGISLIQANYAEENMNKIVDIIQTFSSSVVQRCSATANQSQVVKIRGIKDSVRLKRLVLSQISGLVSNCVQSAALSNQTLSELETTVSQKTDQFLEGINPLAFLGFLALGLVGVPLTIGGVLFVYLGQILVLVGSGLIIWAVSQKTQKTEIKLFSGLYNSENDGKVDVTANFYTENQEPTLDQIVKVFDTHAAYAFDLNRCEKKVYMYTDENILSKSLATQDLITSPVLAAEKSKMRNGDLFYDTTSGNLYTKCNDKEILIKTLSSNKTYKLENFNLKDTSTNTIVPDIKWPNLVNVSGWKRTEINKLFLFSGLITIIVGIVFLVIQQKSKSDKK